LPIGGIMIEASRITALRQAIIHKNFVNVQSILQGLTTEEKIELATLKSTAANDNLTILSLAVKESSTQIVELLLAEPDIQAVAAANENELLVLAFEREKKSIVRLLLSIEAVQNNITARDNLALKLALRRCFLPKWRLLTNQIITLIGKAQGAQEEDPALSLMSTPLLFKIFFLAIDENNHNLVGGILKYLSPEQIEALAALKMDDAPNSSLLFSLLEKLVPIDNSSIVCSQLVGIPGIRGKVVDSLSKIVVLTINNWRYEYQIVDLLRDEVFQENITENDHHLLELAISKGYINVAKELIKYMQKNKPAESNIDNKKRLAYNASLVDYLSEKRVTSPERIRELVAGKEIKEFIAKREELNFINDFIKNIYNESEVFSFLETALSYGKKLENARDRINPNKSWFKMSFTSDQLLFYGQRIRRITYIAQTEKDVENAVIMLSTHDKKTILLSFSDSRNMIKSIFVFMRLYGKISNYPSKKFLEEENIDWKNISMSTVYQENAFTTHSYAMNTSVRITVPDYYDALQKASALQLKEYLQKKGNPTVCGITLGCGNGTGLQKLYDEIASSCPILFSAGQDINSENLAEFKSNCPDINPLYTAQGDIYNKEELRKFLHEVNQRSAKPDVVIILAHGILTTGMSKDMYDALRFIHTCYNHFKELGIPILIQMMGLKDLLLGPKEMKAAGFQTEAYTAGKDVNLPGESLEKFIHLFGMQSPVDRLEYLKKRAVNLHDTWDLSMSSSILDDFNLLSQDVLFLPKRIDCSFGNIEIADLNVLLTRLSSTNTTLIYSGREPWADDLPTLAEKFNVPVECEKPTSEFTLNSMSPQLRTRLGI
jgi:hypothetical protein